jgi:hypothetical protein
MTPEEKRIKHREANQRYIERNKSNPEWLQKRREAGLKSHNKNRERRLELSREWKSRNKEKVTEYNKEYYSENIESEKQRCKKWQSKNQDLYKKIKSESDRKYRSENIEKLKAYRKNNREKFATRCRERYATEENYAIDKRLRASLTQAFRLADVKKTISTFKLIGIPIQDFKKHIENQFLPGMSWENRKEWHIDHKIPCAFFDLSKEEEQRKCFHYTNLQPLWSRDNLQKSSLYNGVRYMHKKSQDSIDLAPNEKPIGL